MSGLAAESARTDYGFYPPEIQTLIAKRGGIAPLLRSRLRLSRLVLVALQRDQVIGYLVASPTVDGIAVVHSLYVTGAARNSGTGRKLLTDLESRLKNRGVHKIMLWTEIAADYYQKLGWIRAADLPNHWWGQDFVIMVKPLE